MSGGGASKTHIAATGLLAATLMGNVSTQGCNAGSVCETVMHLGSRTARAPDEVADPIYRTRVVIRHPNGGEIVRLYPNGTVGCWRLTRRLIDDYARRSYAALCDGQIKWER